nr:abscisic acid-responsive (TB2/DP1, HVA22) family protein [Tanacetum cinerariifolium]
MSNMLEDIQYASSDTRPPMLDKTDYESCQHCIRLYCLGKDNGENIMKSIVEGPYQMGTKIVTLAGGVEGLPKDIYALINHYTDTKDIWDNVKMLLEELHLTQETKLQFKTEELLFMMFVVDTMRIIKEDSFRGTMQEDLLELEMLKESGAVLDEEQLLFLAAEQGTKSIYQSFVKPYLSKQEADIDHTLMELKTRAGDSTTLYCS